MKKALLILLALTMMMSMVVIAPIGASAADEEVAIGSVAADYKPEGTAVATAEDFAAMKADGKYYLSADIMVSATYMNDFTGTFDGNGHTITTSVTIFDKVDGTVKNLIVAGSVVVDACETKTTAVVARVGASTADATFDNILNLAPISADSYGLAAIVGNNGGTSGGNGAEFVLTIKNCTNGANITSNAQSNNDSGSMIGMFDGKTGDKAQLVIDNCVNYGTVMAGGRPGGIAGNIDTSANITNCVNYGDVKAIFNYCGGIVARVGQGGPEATFKIENCINYGSLSQSNSKETGKTAQLGGICGYAGKNTNVTFKDCVNNGKIGPSEEVVVNSNYGGIFGTAESGALSLVFQNCVNNGDVTVELAAGKEVTAGGIAAKVGGNTKVLKFENCTNHGDVVVRGGKNDGSKAYVGGITGWIKLNTTEQALISKCTNTGDVTVEDVVDTAEASGIAGYVWGSTKKGGVKIEYCTTTGSVSGSQWVAGLIAYVNCNRVDISYCVVAGTFTNSQKIEKAKENEELNSRQQYAYEYNSETYYFYAPKKAVINGSNLTYNKDENGTKGTIDLTKTASKAPVGTYLWWNESQKVDEKKANVSTIYVEEGSLQAAYICGDGYSVGLTTKALTKTYKETQFESGEVAYLLNTAAGKDVFYQNLHAWVFGGQYVDEYPIPDSTHAKVISTSAGQYDNELFEMNPDCTPATGDATIYVAAALVVSALALGGLVVAKKKKVRD